MSTNTQQTVPVLTNHYVDMYLDDDIIIAKWKGYLTGEQVKEGMAKMIAEARKRGLEKHISNQTELKVLSKEVQDLLTQELLPELAKAGVKKLAVFTSEDIFAKATVDKVNREVKLGDMIINSFNTMEECKDWVNE